MLSLPSWEFTDLHNEPAALYVIVAGDDGVEPGTANPLPVELEPVDQLVGNLSALFP